MAIKLSFHLGIVAGCLNYSSSILMGYIEVDDVIDAIPVHFFNGIWGLIAAGLFTTQEFYAEVYADKYVAMLCIISSFAISVPLCIPLCS